MEEVVWKQVTVRVCPECLEINNAYRRICTNCQRTLIEAREQSIPVSGGHIIDTEKVEKLQSAKVYVFDFHFTSESKIDISEKKAELDRFFDKLRNRLEINHNEEFGKVKCEVFLRKH